ncbi:hypothetical protein U27_05958 [Candidatus Vecturithrix granuli]|uniref:Ice-binding protein C-terminal domain-containing protein n=1 Tax=Vecturithrix granuli TaxID=1499967 RepID=A0A081C328_VECG1|nr:hypothetical protein U27_05958 [Candidatus Vecturithrix granuli]
MKHLTIFVIAVSIFLIPFAAGAMSLVDTQYVKNSDITIKYNGSNRSTSAGEFKAQIRDDDGNLLNDGEWFTGLCVELDQYAKLGGELDVDLVEPSQKEGGLLAAWLFENRDFYKEEHAIWSQYEVTGLQLAIWEVTHDYTDDMNFSLSSGNFQVVKANSYAKNLANFYLTSLATYYDPTGLEDKYRISMNADKQDFIIGGLPIEVEPPLATPEPATLLLLGLGIIGLFGLKHKAKK